MNVINDIKEFLVYRKTINNWKQIELTQLEKDKLKAFDDEIVSSIVKKAYENIAKDVLKGEISDEYLKGYKHSIAHFAHYFKKYN